MAKKSSIARNLQKLILAIRFKKSRALLRDAVKQGDYEAGVKLQKRNRNESMCRVRNRCQQCGRPRGTYRKFGLCRICLRNAAMNGEVPGLKKASW